jgi:hypothetical protein
VGDGEIGMIFIFLMILMAQVLNLLMLFIKEKYHYQQNKEFNKMLNKERQIEELWDLKHRNDTDKDWVDYEDIILDRTLSPYVFQNDEMKSYLDNIKGIPSRWFDQVNMIKNYKNYIVEKDYYKHKN